MGEFSIPTHFDGEQIRLDESIELEPHTKLVVTIRPDDERAAWLHASARKLLMTTTSRIIRWTFNGTTSTVIKANCGRGFPYENRTLARAG